MLGFWGFLQQISPSDIGTGKICPCTLFPDQNLFEHTIFSAQNFFTPEFFWTYQADFSRFNLNITNKTIQFYQVLTQLKLI